MKLKSSDLFSLSWDNYKNNFQNYLVITLPFLITLVPFIFWQRGNHFRITSPLYLILFLLVVVIGVWVEAALIFAIRDPQVKPSQAFSMAKSKIIPWILTQLLVTLTVGVGFLLLVIPGIIFAIWFAFSTILVVDENLKFKSAMVRSKQYVKGNWEYVFWRIFVLGIILSFINFVLNLIFKNAYLSGIVTFLEMIVVIPYSYIYTYKLLQSLHSEEAPVIARTEVLA